MVASELSRGVVWYFRLGGVGVACLMEFFGRRGIDTRKEAPPPPERRLLLSTSRLPPQLRGGWKLGRLAPSRLWVSLAQGNRPAPTGMAMREAGGSGSIRRPYLRSSAM